jgi:hypothetical protein
MSQARAHLSSALRASDYFREVDQCLRSDAKHMRVLRHLLTPPTSQDQFKLLCPSWNKASEKEGGRVKRLKPAVANEVAAKFHEWRDRKLMPWIGADRRPTLREIRRLFDSIAPLLASQEFGTFERTQAAKRQENAVIELLSGQGWTREPSKLIDRRATLAERHFMYKTRFATQTRAKEVDIACGLKDTYILAMECKVTNDETNSVKRVNDVINKANAWKAHWGNFVRTGALLQGVVAPKDVDRLLDAGVHVFWSHDLESLKRWLDENA